MNKQHVVTGEGRWLLSSKAAERGRNRAVDSSRSLRAPRPLLDGPTPRGQAHTAQGRRGPLVTRRCVGEDFRAPCPQTWPLSPRAPWASGAADAGTHVVGHSGEIAGTPGDGDPACAPPLCVQLFRTSARHRGLNEWSGRFRTARQLSPSKALFQVVLCPLLQAGRYFFPRGQEGLHLCP